MSASPCARPSDEIVPPQLRQATYTTARLGIFSQISEYAKQMNGGKNLPLWQKAACGLAAGGLGALVGTPADLTLIRMQVGDPVS
jgi:solute carrier family 25 (mitochondrial oxoglutarate transporter), member 11